MKKIIFIGLLFAPTLVFANVRISEVAWMGDSVSSDHEWIELYNDGDSSQDLSGWKLSATDSGDDTKQKFSISLTGMISGKGYFLIESKRSSKDTAPYLASDFTGISFSLVNGGETLWLKNSGGSQIDEVRSPFKTKWEKGNNDTKETMQWNGIGWIAAPATPRKENETIDTSVSDTSTGSGDTKTDTSDTDKTTSPSSTLDTSAHVSPLPLSDFSQKQELYISAGRNRIVSAGSPVLFEAYAVDAKGVKTPGISSVWSFGDGGQAGGTKVLHTYSYPGDYAVVLNANVGGNEAVSRAEVKVFSPKITMGLEDDGTVSLTNNSPYEVNIGGWKISGMMNQGGVWSASSDTIIKAGKKIIFPKTITGIDFSSFDSLKLLSPDGMCVANYTKIPTVISATTIVSVASPEIPTVEKKSETVVIPEETEAPLIVVSRPKAETQTASVALAVPKKESDTETSSQTIVLKKPEGFFAKMWNFLFR